MIFDKKFWPYKEDKKINWGLFPLFLIICLLVSMLLIYFILPSFFSGDVIKRIPIIINDGREKALRGDEIIN